SYNRKDIVANFKNMLREANYQYEIVQKIFFRTSRVKFKEPPLMKDICACIYGYIRQDISELKAKEQRTLTEDKMQKINEKERQWEEFFNRHYERQIAVLNKKITRSKKSIIAIL